jgi:hypothetical protein
VIIVRKLLTILVILIALIGIVSADTVVLYATDDQDLWRLGSGMTWANVRDGAGTSSDSTALYSYLQTDATGWVEMDRTGLSFNLSTLSGKTITGVKLGMYGNAKRDGFTTDANFVITNASPTTWNSWATSDYEKFGQTLLGNYSYSSFSTTGYNNITLNSAGVSYFNGRAGTNATIMWRNEWDYDNFNRWQNTVDHSVKAYAIVEAGTTKDPFVEITYNSGATPPVASFTINRNMARIPQSITVTDTSTNTPTSWQWSWGDGTANSTTQNPSHTYTKRGQYSINLAATNAGGTGIATAQTIRVVGYENYY